MKSFLTRTVWLFLINFLLFSETLAQKGVGSELVMSMTQRSLVMPGYLTELKALIARQAYNFWSTGNTEPYVSHLNVYNALHQANKYLDGDSTDGKVYNQTGFHLNKVTSIKFGDDPNVYYTGSADGSILKWQLKSPASLPEVVYQSDHIIRSIDISGDGHFLLATFYQTGLALIPLKREISSDIDVLHDPEPIQAAVFVPGEDKYLSVTKSGELKIKGFTSAVYLVGKTDKKINELVVDENDGTIYAGSASGTMEAWEKPYQLKDSEIGGILDSLDTQSYFGYTLGTYAINCMDLSPDGKRIAIGRERGDVILWNIAGKKIERVISSHQSAITDIDFSPDNRMLLTTSRDKTARIWDLDESRKLPIILDDHQDWVYAGSFDPSGNIILTGSGDRLIRSWPLDPLVLATRICEKINRSMTQEEWSEFVGKDVPYQFTCQ